MQLLRGGYLLGMLRAALITGGRGGGVTFIAQDSCMSVSGSFSLGLDRQGTGGHRRVGKGALFM